MEQELLDQLQNPDPAVRRKAIIRLGRSKDLAALKPLSDVYHDDPVPELRELARQAGRYIQQQNEPEPEPVPPPVDEALEPPPAEVVPSPIPPEDSITADDVQRGRGHTRAARDLYEAGDPARAIKALALALHADRGLVNEPVFVNLTSRVLGAPPRAAIRTLLDPERRQAAYRAALAAQRRRPRPASSSGCLLGTVLLWLAAVLVIAVLGVAIWWAVDEDQPASLQHTYAIWRITNDERALDDFTYYVYEPDGAIPAGGWAVLVALHGGGGTGEDMLTRDLLKLAEDERALLVAPNFGAYDDEQARQAQLSALLTHLAQTTPVDVRGAVVFGREQGAMFATEFLAAHPEQVYAVVADAPVAVIVPEAQEDAALLVRPLAVLYGEGDANAAAAEPDIEALRALGFPVDVQFVPAPTDAAISQQSLDAARRFVRQLHTG